MTRLYDRLVPAKALRWTWLTLGDGLCVGGVLRRLWDAATADMPPGVIEVDGNRYPLVEFSDEWDHLPKPWEDPS